MLGVNLTGPFLVSQRAARAMVATGGGGAFVHIASIAALAGDGEQVAYGASKAALLGLNRIMAIELARHGIRSNVVHPGYTATPLTRQYVGEEMYAYMMGGFARIPQGRMALPEEIAAAVAFLASDDAAAITGTDLVVDGGHHGQRLRRGDAAAVKITASTATSCSIPPTSATRPAATRTTSSSRCTPTRASAAPARPT